MSTTVTGTWNRDKKCIDVHPLFWEELGDSVKSGVEITAVVTTASHPEQLRWYWWMLGRICESGSWDGDKASLDHHTRSETKFGKSYPLNDGREVFVADSIALSNCDSVTFARFVHFAERFWAERLGVDVDYLKREADQLRLTTGQPRRGRRRAA